MVDRELALSRLTEGDLFHARAPNGASLICLVVAVTESAISAWRIGPCEDVEFDRRSGIALGEVPSRIDCVAPFPREMADVFLGLDRRYRIVGEMDCNGIEPNPELLKLTGAEKRALLLVDEHVSNDLI